jgi:hypothetical protein
MQTPQQRTFVRFSWSMNVDDDVDADERLVHSSGDLLTASPAA